MKQCYFWWVRTLSVRACCIIALLLAASVSVRSQIVVSADKTAAQLASELLGSGVIIIGPTLTCPGNANGTFVTGSVSPLGIGRGIILTTGCSKDTLGSIGVNDPSTSFANRDNLAPGDADLDALSGSGHLTHDACVLEFDFKAAGDTISFNYVFGSEEYRDYTCSPYNDVFGFFISGGAYVTPTNIALVPGTTIPVCINSVNCGPDTTTSWILDSCAVLGPGSPFCAYYVSYVTTPSPFVTYDGVTTRLKAIARVNPCDTYHLKLGVADASDGILDSGVFIEGGSLSSSPPATLSAVGTPGSLLYAGLPCCIRGCAPGRFNFSIPDPRDTNYVVHYTISGTALNGYDYGSIADSVTILATTTVASVLIDPSIVTPAGPKIVTLTIQVPDPCHPGVFTPGATASIIILDSFSFRILTPDTAICFGQHVDIQAVGDTAFPTLLHYRWTPAATLNDDTLLSPTATPVVTITYTLRDSTPPILGCAVQAQSVTITVYNRPTLTTDSPYVKTCVGVPVGLHVYASGSSPFVYLWSPATDLSSSTIYNPVVNPSAAGDVTYTVSVGPAALPACNSIDTVHVHILPNDFILLNPDTAICIGQSVQTRVNGSNEFTWLWTPPTGVSVTTIKQPVITPTVTTTYTVTASYAHCPDMGHSFQIEVDEPAPTRFYTDTICLGMSDSVDFSATGPGYYHYQWTPATYVSNDTIPNPVFTPTLQGNYTWNLVIQPHAAACSSAGVVNLLVTPNSISVDPNDTAICKGDIVQIRGAAFPLFSYQWLPTAGIPVSNIIDPIIRPDTTETYVVTASFRKCPDMHDTVRIDVQPKPFVFTGGNRTLCQYDTIRLSAFVDPAWYTHYSYSWTPATNLDDPSQPTVIFYGHDLVPELLHLTVTTPAGCSSVDSALITIYPGDFGSMQPNMSFCPHDTAMLLPTGGDTYRWSPGLYLSDSTSPTPIIRPITSQTYTIIATSAFGCKDTLHFTAFVHPSAAFSLDDSVVLHPGESYQINPQTNCTIFTWSPAAGLDYWRISNPLATPQISTRYKVHAMTEYGCNIVDSIDVIVDPETLLTLPNAFSPGSSPNSEFKIIKRGIATLNYFRIFNRWGNLVFETTDIDKGWNGEYKGVPQPYGVFVYEVEAMTSTGKLFRKHGNLTLIR